MGFTLQWHLTNVCDQRCTHCYIYSGETPLKSNMVSEHNQREIVDKFSSFCKESGFAPHIALTGGDPLLYSHFWELLDYIHSKGIGFSIYGNPFHLTKEKAEKLAAYGCSTYFHFETGKMLLPY